MFVYARGIVNNGFFEEQMQFYCPEFFFSFHLACGEYEFLVGNRGEAEADSCTQI